MSTPIALERMVEHHSLVRPGVAMNKWSSFCKPAHLPKTRLRSQPTNYERINTKSNPQDPIDHADGIPSLLALFLLSLWAPSQRYCPHYHPHIFPLSHCVLYLSPTTRHWSSFWVSFVGIQALFKAIPLWNFPTSVNVYKWRHFFLYRQVFFDKVQETACNHKWRHTSPCSLSWPCSCRGTVSFFILRYLLQSSLPPEQVPC